MKFIEDIHKYMDGEDIYTPVTTLLHKFEPYKDWNKIAAAYAKKNKRTVEDVLAEWDKTKNDAAAKGTRYHNKKEQELLNQQGIVLDNYMCEINSVPTIDGIKEDLSIKLENNSVYPEKMIWSTKYKVCGTADLVEVVNNVLHIKDHKTNKKLDFESYNHPYKGKEKLTFPLGHLDNCNFNIYQLQLNLYMYMLLQQNRHLKMGTMTILHVTFDENDEPINVTEVPVKDMQDEVRKMLEHFKNKS